MISGHLEWLMSQRQKREPGYWEDDSGYVYYGRSAKTVAAGGPSSMMMQSTLSLPPVVWPACLMPGIVAKRPLLGHFELTLLRN